MADKDLKNDAYWRDKLTPEEFHVCRQQGTERAFTGVLLDQKSEGIFTCRCCQEPLFKSDAKFDSGSGWPSFFAALDDEKIDQIQDVTHGMMRTEVRCRGCGSHLGHVFPDGPAPTGLRYCVNSLSLGFSASLKD